MESLLTGVDNALYTKLNRSDILVPEKNEILEEMFFSSMLASTAFSINTSQGSPPSQAMHGGIMQSLARTNQYLPTASQKFLLSCERIISAKVFNKL
jgi:hypothetical protein